MQRDRHKKLYFNIETAALKCRVSERAQHRIKLGSAVLEGQYHFPQALLIDSDPGNSVKTYLSALTIRTDALQLREPARVTAAPTAIIHPRTFQKPVPTSLTQPLVSLANARSAIHAHSGPEELIESLEREGAGLLGKKSPFWPFLVHGRNYTNERPN